ncbi:glutathione transferase GST 23-like [Abrus precatorius]|uniref:glutathione transferase n=1 Tax=Abrus precatorius TaxID=3816 RepID=A0A8B8KMX5_ABRPR|nr:glutathione transferase GST 23-like [Abrus precatorius]
MMGSEEVKLVNFWVSPFGKRVEWALKLKGIQYEYIEEDIFNKSNLLLELNPIHKKVPVLIHRNKPIAESFIIVEYIDETWNHCPLLPPHPHQRALARFWATTVEQKLGKAGWVAMSASGDEQEKAVKEATEMMEKIEEEIKGKKFFGGDNIGYLDIALGWISYLLPVWEEVGSMQIIDPLKYPSTTAWMTNFLNHPVIKDTLPPRDKMLVYYHSRKNTWPSSIFQNLVKLLEAAWIAMCTKGDVQKKLLKEASEMLEKIEEEIKGKKFFGGDNIGYLDVALGWISYWLPVWEEVGSTQIMDPVKCPAIIAWMNNFLNHPVIKDTLPPRDKMLVYFNNRREALSSTFQDRFKV